MSDVKEFKDEELNEVSGGSLFEEEKVLFGDVFLSKDTRSQINKPGIVIVSNYSKPTSTTPISCRKFSYNLLKDEIISMDYSSTILTYGEIKNDYIYSKTLSGTMKL